MSTVGLVKAALRELWTAAFPETVQITNGNRVTVSGSERITIGGAIGTSAAEGHGPTRPMEEDYEVLCRISVTAWGSVDDQEPVTGRVLELFEAAELAVRSSPSQTLGVPGVLWALVEGDWELREAEASETGGPINSSFEFRVHVRARYRLN